MTGELVESPDLEFTATARSNDRQASNGRNNFKGKGQDMKQDDEELSSAEVIRIAGDIVAAHVSNNSVAVNDLPQLIANVHGALAGLTGITSPEPQQASPRVPVRTSVKPDYIPCLECGSRKKMLKRHLATAHHLEPDQYRDKYGLPKSYPMVAPNYAEQRRELAVSIGLGKGARAPRRRKAA